MFLTLALHQIRLGFGSWHFASSYPSARSTRPPFHGTREYTEKATGGKCRGLLQRLGHVFSTQTRVFVAGFDVLSARLLIFGGKCKA